MITLTMVKNLNSDKNLIANQWAKEQEQLELFIKTLPFEISYLLQNKEFVNRCDYYNYNVIKVGIGWLLEYTKVDMAKAFNISLDKVGRYLHYFKCRIRQYWKVVVPHMLEQEQEVA